MSAHVGVMFDYPTKYVATSTHVGEGHVIVLLPQGYVAPEAGEGPATITVQQFSNAEGLPLATFVRNEPMTNFGLSSGETTDLVVDGQLALGYSYSGLYENDAVAVAANGSVYVFSAADDTRAELPALLQTVKFMTDHAH
jgi:hypothetical protein